MRHLAETGVSAMWCGQERLLLGTFPHILILYVVYHTDFFFLLMYEGWNFNSGSYLFTTDTK